MEPLFLPSHREATAVHKKVEIVCSQPYQNDEFQPQRAYHILHPITWPDNRWPLTTTVACHHCCHTFESQPVPLPKAFLVEKNVYVTQGVFCSLGCAKTYAIERVAYNAPHTLMLLGQLARNVFHYKQLITPAPPVCRLRTFGGDLTIEEFRKKSLSHITCLIHEAPFITSTMISEEQSRRTSSSSSSSSSSASSASASASAVTPWDINCIRIPLAQEQSTYEASVPPPTPLFKQFAEEQALQPLPEEVSVKPVKRKRVAAPVVKKEPAAKVKKTKAAPPPATATATTATATATATKRITQPPSSLRSFIINRTQQSTTHKSS